MGDWLLAAAFLFSLLSTTLGLERLQFPDVDAPFYHHLQVGRRQASIPPDSIPIPCRPICEPVRARVAVGCRAITCCNQPFINSYVECYKCQASEYDIVTHGGAKNVVSSIVRQCGQRNITLQEPVLPASGPLSFVDITGTTTFPLLTRFSTVAASPTPSTTLFPSGSEDTDVTLTQVTFRPTASTSGDAPDATDDDASSATRFGSPMSPTELVAFVVVLAMYWSYP